MQTQIDEDTVVNLPFPDRRFQEGEFGRSFIYLIHGKGFIANAISKSHRGKIQIKISYPQTPDTDLKLCGAIRHIPEDGRNIPPKAVNRLAKMVLLRILTADESDFLVGVVHSGQN